LTTVIAEPTLTQKVRGLGRTQLEVYQNIQYLSVLNSIVLNSEFSYAKTLAATLIAKSARTHLQSDKNVKSDDSGNANTLDNNNNRSPAVTASVIKNFEESKEVLSNVLHLGDLDTSLASALNEAILAIDDSLT
ncbi:MAG: hypothetical protein KDD40_12295, partial [Bdellovibrionales bacterium]|nr:hypothetical protein [Bdellovibrionales bacterium]